MKKRVKSYESNWFERIVSVSLLLVFVLVIVTGILSFVMLNGIITTIDDTIRPNRSISMIKDIYNDLMQAENHVKVYNLTNNREDLDRYNSLIGSTGEKIKELKVMVGAEEVFAPYADTLEVLVEKKFDGLDMLLIIKDAYPVKDAIQDFMLNVSGEIQPRILSDSAKSEDLEQMAKKIRKATKDALAEEKVRSELEQEWTARDRRVTDRLRELIAGLDVQTARYIREHTELTENKATKVKSIILVFGVASAILLVLAGIVIFLYIRRNDEYRHILKKARADAEELARARQQFLANMSHEIKTPMNIISGYLGQILKSPLEPGLQEQVRIVRKSSDHLLELLNNLLDLSRLQANKLDLIQAEFSPGEMVSDMYQWFTPLAREKNLELITDTDPGLPLKLTGDQVRLRQILFNLVSNAIKYTDSGSVTIKARSGPNENDTQSVIYEVIDTGAGISGEDLRSIFAEFTQGAVAKGKAEGSGLGLNIASRLVELMGGRLDVRSTPGKGSAFRVEIPFLAAPAYHVEAGTDLPAGESLLKGLRILVVDDETFNRGLLRMILGKYQCDILECGSGQEAIAIAREQDLDLVLIDIRMPGISGPEAASEIRDNFASRGKNVPVIAMSAAITAEDNEKLRQAGIMRWISKPYEENQLVAALLGVIKNTEKPGQENEKIENAASSNPAPGGASFDLEAFRKSSSGNTEFFKEMVNLFLKNTDEGLNEMAERITEGEWEDVSAIAHRISAPCRHFRAERLYSLLKEAELQSGQGNQAAGEAVRTARVEFESIRRAILSEPGFKTS